MKLLLILVFSLFCIACSSNGTTGSKLEAYNDKNFKALDGVVVFDESSVNYNVKIYKEDNSLLNQFIFEDDFFDSSIQPYALNPESILLVFKCLGENSDYYKVIVNEKRKIIGYIPKKDKRFYFESWDKHLLKVFSVDFNSADNPIKLSPDENAKVIPYDKDEFYHPVEVKGDWLKISWDQKAPGNG